MVCLLAQGGNARYRLRAIFKSEEGCPASVYKCMRPQTGRNLVWVKQETDTFKGKSVFIQLFINIILNEALNTLRYSFSSTQYSYAGCPVVGKSCNMSSSVPEENNVLAIEVAYTHTECAGKLRTKVLNNTININQM